MVLSEGSGMELWKRKRLLEMRRLMLEKEAAKQKPEKNVEEDDPKKILEKLLVGRAWEVLHAAEWQYPAIAEKVKAAFVQLSKQGKLKGQITGEQLLWFFRDMGLNIRLETKIRVLESGELKTLADKLRGS
jgi:DNA-binding TFAR19-related protein (PDSD5 family)